MLYSNLVMLFVILDYVYLSIVDILFLVVVIVIVYHIFLW